MRPRGFMSWLSAVVAVDLSIVPVVALHAPSPSAWYGSPSGCAPPGDVQHTAAPHCSDHSTAFRLRQSSWLTRRESSGDGRCLGAASRCAPALHCQSSDRTPCRRGCTTHTVLVPYGQQSPSPVPIACRSAFVGAQVGISIYSYAYHSTPMGLNGNASRYSSVSSACRFSSSVGSCFGSSCGNT